MTHFDKLFINGKIHTMEDSSSVYRVMGVRNGKFAYVGNDSNFDADDIVDLQGSTVIPGMADAHMHMYAYCQNLVAVDLSEVRSIEELINVMKAMADETPEGLWVKGVNFDQTLFDEKRMPNRHDLDKISVNHPITVRRVCLHAIVVNTKGLEMAGVGVGYTPEGGGVVELEDDGKPNGVLREQCTQVIDNVIKDPLKDEKMKEKVMLEVFKDMTEKGITTIHTYSAKIWNYEESMETYEGFEKRGILPVRVTVCLDELFDAPDKINDNPDKLVQLGAYKLFTDGSLGANSAKLREPYEGLDTAGLMICTEDELYERMKIAYDRGLQPAIHAIGDKALEITLDAIEKTLENSDRKPNLPFRIIHVQMTPPDLLERMIKLPVVLDIQPIFLRTDLHWIEDKIGKERAKQSYMWKTMADIGLIEAGSSDCPVESYNPIFGIYSAVTRCDFDGFPTGGYNPSEKVPVFEAVAMYTKNAHYATGQENMMGLIKENYFADFAILDRDIFEIDELDILNVKVKGTYLAGKKVY